MRVLAIVPAFNEELSLGTTLAEIIREVPYADVVVVDDGSTDATRTIALSHGVKVLSLPFNLGVGGAMRAGYLYASRCGYDAAVQVDADGQHHPRDLPTLVAGLQNADIVIGARFAGVGDYEVKGPRAWAMRFLARRISRLTKVALTDVTSGFRATSGAAIELFAANYPSEYLGDTVEALAMAHRAGLRIAQVPVEMRPRRSGQPSQSSFSAAVFLRRAGLALLLAALHRDVTTSHQLVGDDDQVVDLAPTDTSRSSRVSAPPRQEGA